MSKCSESASASGSALGSALDFAVAKVLIISSSEIERPTISMWSTDSGGAGRTGGKYGLLTQMERCIDQY